MVFAPSKILKTSALLLLAATYTHGASLTSNAVTVLDDVEIMDHYSPMFAGPIPLDKVATIEVTFDNKTVVTLAPVDLNKDGAAGRMLESTSTDLSRIESFLGATLEYNFDALKSKYRSGSLATSPWPSSYWPMYRDSVNYEWNSNDMSATEKYAKAFGKDVTGFQNSVSASTGIDSRRNSAKVCTQDSECVDWLQEKCAKRKGRSSGYCIPSWYGICHAWAPAAILETEPQCGVTYNGVYFRVLDIKALLSEVYDGANVPVVFTGARFDGALDTAVDQYGRYVDPSRRDIGPGFFHLATTNILGRFKKSFIVDISNSASVWNQPVRSYEVLQMDLLPDASAASKLYFNTPTYPFNSAMKYLAKVQMKFSYIDESWEDGPEVSTGRVDGYTLSKIYDYLLELDANKNVIGGEWLGNSMKDHPDFLWIPKGKPSANSVTSVGLSYADVNKLMTLATTGCGTAPPTPAVEAYGNCGNDALGPQKCVSGYYCQPWNPTFYQCRPVQTQCGVPEVGVDYYGADLSSHWDLYPWECCDKCTQTAGCKAYTFINYAANGPTACYLKTGKGEYRRKVGAISSALPASTCNTPLGGQCGSSQGTSCCPEGSYCFPWDHWYYQCVSKPAQCSQQFTDVDFYGQDLFSIGGISSAECCAKCAATAGCKTYSFVNENASGVPTCYLKTGTSGKRASTGVVSGILN